MSSFPLTNGTGVAFAPEPCWVAFAPEWSGMKWVQGQMWPSFRGECDPCFCVAGSIVSEPQKDFFHPRESYSRVMRRSNSHFNQLPGHYGCYGVPLLRCNIHFEQLRRCFGCYVPTATSINCQHAMDATWCYVVTPISSNLEDTLDATFQQPFQSTSSTLWMLRCNIHFEQLRRRLGWYVPTAIWINFQDTMDATVYLCYVVTSISSNFEDALDVTFQEPFQSTSRILWMLGCKIHFEHLRRRFGCYTLTVISFNFPDALVATW